MKRRAFLAGLVSGLTLAGPALAGDVIEGIVRQLKKQGFRSVVQERTLLGRVRILAKRKDGSREIIVNPRTGEILRDLWTPLTDASVDAPVLKEVDDNDGKGSGGDDEDEDDDEEDEEEDEDESEESGSNSGSGSSSGNSGSGSSDGSSDDDGDEKD